MLYCGIPLLLARRPADLLVLVHQLVFRGAPRRDHFVQILRGGAHCLQFCLPAAFLRRDVEAERLAVPRNRQGLIGFEIPARFSRNSRMPILTVSILCTHCTHSTTSFPPGDQPFPAGAAGRSTTNWFQKKQVGLSVRCIRIGFHIIEEPELVHFAQVNVGGVFEDETPESRLSRG